MIEIPKNFSKIVFLKTLFKGAVGCKIKGQSIPILILFRSTFKIKKLNSLLTWSISHLVPKVFWF